MNRYLLTVALDHGGSGQHEIQVTTVTRRTLGVQVSRRRRADL